ncbi:armadillo-type protein [Syncephalis pseudoplumigaleata]|uniref:Armadillo-type protein n=1 Tax=Syncephalis pseudoplumigaleata TaxID=1712513 RepID=A0A4P9YU38_9FUNG|nr:armadillo-type protein [Syncephalis pseudoplumigaleata]|eukprot:RKP23305.1 armadillo-type protein [Syncephalis pseudoplumigaleata]
MAGELCNGNVDRLQRYVCQYFTDVLLATNKSSILAESEKQNIKGAHQLIVELYRVAPGLLLNVIPQLEEELSLSNTYLRMLATSSLGELFSARASSLVDAYPSTWKAWLSRKNDKSTMVRAAWTEYLAKLYTNHPKLAADLNAMAESAQAKLLDPEERVRAAACQAIGALDMDVILNHVDVDVLKQLGQRCRDKKVAPRVEALKALGRMYKLTYARREDERVQLKMGWIPGEFLNILYANDSEMIATMEAFLVRDILPLDENDEERARRFVHVVSGLDVKAQKALLALMQRKAAAMKEMQTFIDYCRMYNRDARKRIEHASADMSDTFTVLIRRISYDIVHFSLIPCLIQRGWGADRGDASDAMRRAARTLLQMLAQVYPFLFRDYVPELVRMVLEEQRDGAAIDGLDILATCSVAYPDMVSLEISAVQFLLDKCRHGAVDEAKQSAILLAHQSSEEAVSLREAFVKETAVPSATLEYAALVPRLSALRSLAFYVPAAFESTSQVLVQFLVKSIILNNDAPPTTGASCREGSHGDMVTW